MSTSSEIVKMITETDELEKLREANMIACELLRQRECNEEVKRNSHATCVKEEEMKTDAKPNHFDIWGANEYLHKNNSISYVEKYLQRTEKLLEENKKVIAVTKVTSYKVVENIESLYSKQISPGMNDLPQLPNQTIPDKTEQNVSIYGSSSDLSREQTANHNEQSTDDVNEKATPKDTFDKVQNSFQLKYDGNSEPNTLENIHLECELSTSDVVKRSMPSTRECPNEEKEYLNSNFTEPQGSQETNDYTNYSNKKDASSDVNSGSSGELLNSLFLKLLLTDDHSTETEKYSDQAIASKDVMQIRNKIHLKDDNFTEDETLLQKSDFKDRDINESHGIYNAERAEICSSNPGNVSRLKRTNINSYGRHTVLESKIPQLPKENSIFHEKIMDLEGLGHLYFPKFTYSLEALPDEMILKIFSYLSHKDLKNVSCVCHRLSGISKDPYLWQTLQATRIELNRKWFESVLCAKPRSIHLQNCTSKGLPCIYLRTFFRNCSSSLRQIHISQCRDESLFGDNILLHLSSRCHKVKSVSIPWSNVTNNGISALATSAIVLEYLDISGNCFICDESFKKFINRKGNSLKSLKLTGCFALSCDAFLAMSQSCPNLSTLHMGLCSKLTSECIRNVFVSLTNLQKLDLRGLKAVTNTCLQLISENCTILTKVVIANCSLITDVGISEFTANLPNLYHIDISGCKKITDNGVSSLAVNLVNLRHLNMSSTGGSFVSVDILTENCFDTLQTLKLSFCSNITNDSIKKLISFCYKLRCIHIHGCKRVKIDDVNKSNSLKIFA